MWFFHYAGKVKAWAVGTFDDFDTQVDDFINLHKSSRKKHKTWNVLS